MKTLLGLIGSPRKMGNSELLVKEIHRQLPDGWDLKLLRLSEFDIKPCIGCYQCLYGDMKCVLKDDYAMALDALVQADAFVLAAPTYFLGANSSVKRFLDRSMSLYRHIDQIWGKPAVGIVVAGMRGQEGYAKLQVDSFIKLCMADHRGTETVIGALPGEVLVDHHGRDASKKLANALVTENSESGRVTTIPTCPQCGGDTFRFLDTEKLKCMLCSSEGSYFWDEKRLQTAIPRPEHPLFLTYEDAKNHLAWLQGMKDAFLAKRKELKAATGGYSEDGEWIRPRSTGE